MPRSQGPTIGQLPLGSTFRMDYFGRHGTRFAGEAYLKRGEDQVVALVDGRRWSLAQCGLSPDSVVHGPVWGPSTGGAS